MIGRLEPEDFNKGERVQVLVGRFTGYIGLVERADQETRKLHVLVSFFGKEISAEVDFTAAKKVQQSAPFATQPALPEAGRARPTASRWLSQVAGKDGMPMRTGPGE